MNSSQLGAISGGELLRRDNWLCVDCLKRDKVVRAREVHHIVEIIDGGNEFDLGNTESLCRKCHRKKTLQNRILRKNKCTISNFKPGDKEMIPTIMVVNRHPLVDRNPSLAG